MGALFLSENDNESREASIPIHICRPQDWENFKSSLSDAQRTFAQARNFQGETDQRVQLPGQHGEISTVLFGAGSADKDVLGGIRAGALSKSLPSKTYHFATLPEDWDANIAAIGWGLGAYKFDAYLEAKKSFPSLILRADQDRDEINNIVEAIHFGRDLINTPSNDMGPCLLYTSDAADD